MKQIKNFSNFISEAQTKGITAYHGSKSSIEEFSDEYVGKGNDQEGPGIYFTTTESDAHTQGGPLITKVELTLKKLVPYRGVSPVSKKIHDELLYMVNAAPDKEKTLTNWAEDPRTALFNAMDSIGNQGGPHRSFLSVWSEFYKKNPKLYVRNMVKLGYDGISIPKKFGVTHYVVFNPLSIKIIEEAKDEITKPDHEKTKAPSNPAPISLSFGGQPDATFRAD